MIDAAPRHAHERYRRDIDGLRAVAVLSVVFFHAGLPGFSGGFVGVDVFFVISGYLITGIILREAREGRFSLLGFYDRRIRRILPAFFVVVVATGLVASLLFLPGDFRAFGQSLIATALFSSNILFWRQSGYFDAPAELKPLLHTWSLSVEEQFYLVFPLAMMLILRRLPHRSPERPSDSASAGKALVGAVGCAALASFAAGFLLTARAPEAAFFLLPTRAWELLAGALIALGGERRMAGRNRFHADLAGLAGILLIALAVFLYGDKTAFPGVAALLPVLGAALVIWSGQGGAGPVQRWLGVKPFVAVGWISYSLYLWHWPVLVLMQYAFARRLSPGETVFAIALSFALAALSWRFVEMPLRRPGALGRPAVFRAAGVVLGSFACLGAGLVASGGLPQRLPPAIAAYDEESEAGARRACHATAPVKTDLASICVVGNDQIALPTFAILGDSHAEALIPALEQAGIDSREKGLVFARHACRPALGLAHLSPDGSLDHSCSDFVRKAVEEIRARPSIRQVVLIARWSRQILGTGFDQDMTYYVDAQSETASPEENRRSLLRGLDRLLGALDEEHVTFVGMVPENDFHPPVALAMARLFGRSPPTTSRSEFLARDEPVRALFAELSRHHRFDVAYPADRLCDETGCFTEIAGRPLYRDDDHLNSFGALQMEPLLEDVLTEDEPAR